jgi:methionyl aminopeptidase
MLKLQNNQSAFDNQSLIVLKDRAWLKRQKHAGRCVSNILKGFDQMIKEKTPNLSLLDIENMALLCMKYYDCTPTFKNYKGFPGSVCLSVNKQLVHGIPNDYVLRDGDIVSLDLGATYEGAIADSARTAIYGEPKNPEHVRLINACKEALNLAIKSIAIGKKLGVIGNAISKHAKNTGFNVIENYGGHGIDYNKPHAEPFVANKANSNEGITIQPGLSIAIEPMFVIGAAETKTDSLDKWTVTTPGIGAHFEDCITIMEDGNHFITAIYDS